MTQDPSWPAALARNVGGEVRYLREKAKLSAQALADALTAFGLPYSRAQVTNLEAQARPRDGGADRRVRRGTVTIGEVIAFAAVLDVTPLQLIFPVGRESRTEVQPGRSVDTWVAAKWFSGEEPLPKPDGSVHTEDDVDRWVGRTSYRLFKWRELDAGVDQWFAAAEAISGETRAAGAATDPQVRELRMDMLRLRQEELKRLEAMIASERSDLRAEGLDPGPLDERLAHIEQANDDVIQRPTMDEQGESQ